MEAEILRVFPHCQKRGDARAIQVVWLALLEVAVEESLSYYA